MKLCNNTAATLEQSKELLNKVGDDTATINERVDTTVQSVTTALAQADANLAAIQTSLENAFSDINRYNDYVSTGLAADVTIFVAERHLPLFKTL